MAGVSKAELVSQECGKSIGTYLEIKPIFEDESGNLLVGFGAYWNEDQYLDKSATISVLFSSENVIYFYSESSDVSGDVFRCDTQTGAITSPIQGYSHYPSCADVNKSIAAETNRGAVYYDYCVEHPED